MRPLRLINELNHVMQRGMVDASHQVVAVGIIAWAGFPLFYWLWTEWFPQPYESLTLRLIGSFLGLGLILTPYWPAKLKPLVAWYWFFAIFYIFAFFFAYFFLMNHASVISAMSLLCSIFLLVLVVDLPRLMILLIVGWSLALLCHNFSTPIIYFGEEHLEMLVMIFFVIFICSILNHKTAILQQQRLAGMAAVAGMIAHELRTPLLGIKSGAKAMAVYSPQLLNAYSLAKEHGLLQRSFRETRLQRFGEINERIISEIDYANTIIDMLLIKAGRENSLQNCVLETCSMAQCLSDAIARYPFKSARQKMLVKWEGDFIFEGSKLLMQHVLFNLLKNALYAIETAQKGSISIWVMPGKNVNNLFFKDTAKGMTAKQQSRLFNHFYSTTFMGTGLGLSFCKLVMKRFGGDICCEAKEGEYTQFQLTFPLKEASLIPSPNMGEGGTK